ncbi:Coenzyme F420-reducing hydrogenase, beta subunit [Rhodovastum atsumiense]|uniref:Hydrogenase n=1 Tax=Rhodovastum atsumiense TaxID=504468 RepID=A0A5M6IKF9_9PROT|nr:4Fe-4S dicluster domain-containing protein [Rhodovastum atsumiense]KAA5608743.1 hydrogenase [Rhodovastum atsumiense]CAH2603048.1 Coenzyme F420-reducing hydrogenase, beta subunit [Rhodovastum atsumiense]
MIAPQAIRACARDLLQSGKARTVLGYRRGTAGCLAEPAFMTSPEETATLVFDPTCVGNLALYLVNEKKRIRQARQSCGLPLGIVAKGCDSRAITVLLQENYIKRGEVIVLGVSCGAGGMVDMRKLGRTLHGKTATAVHFDGPRGVTVSYADGSATLPAKEVLADRCLECTRAYPLDADFLFGEKIDERPYGPRFAAVTAFASKSREERSAYWNAHFERCIRCYACRAVCPMCYCDECVVDSTSFIIGPTTTADDKANRVSWINRSATPSENAMYHMVRSMHLAGRCTDCGECERVCPMNIPLRLLNTMLEREAYEAFQYAPGLDADLASLISSFRDGDPDDFVR